MARIVAVGEAYGADEAAARRPFVGKSGQLMNRLFEEAGLLPRGSSWRINNDLRSRMYRSRDATYEACSIHLTNVFNIHPPGNRIPALCGKERINGLPAIKAGQYIRREFLNELDRLERELSHHKPNVIIAMGATASWFLLKSPSITKLRGAIASSPYGKVLPTFHPAYLFRGEWKYRPVVIMDLAKAARESEYPEVRRPPRYIFIPESVDDIERICQTELKRATRLSVDIETVENQITCIGFAWSPEHALVIPITDLRNESGSYWSHNEELRVWAKIAEICGLSAPKIFQNGCYDLHFLWRQYGITVANCTEDTMLCHHALYPEMPKGLAFLGSLYTQEACWKLMRAKGKHTLKDDKEQ